MCTHGAKKKEKKKKKKEGLAQELEVRDTQGKL
jgi:hypothetical protein